LNPVSQEGNMLKLPYSQMVPKICLDRINLAKKKRRRRRRRRRKERKNDTVGGTITFI
jgi:hypothetical protein